MIRPLLN